MLAIVHAMPMERRTACLDYGCGSGYGTELLATYFPRTIGLDTSLKAIDYARVMHTRSGAQFVTQLHHADPPAKFDFITCIELIEHLPQDEARKLLQSFAYLLAPEGRLVLTTPIANPNGMATDHHLKEYGMDEFESFLSEFFGVVEVQDISVGMPNMIAICLEPKL